MAEIRDTDIAIVGMACRFPGASSPEEFWRNIRDGIVSIRRLSPEELAANGATESEWSQQHYVPVSAALGDVKGFDAAFFGIGPRDAAIMDPQHRHFLEVAWEALEHAGHAPGTSEARVGVFAGSGLNTYFLRNLMTHPELVDSVGLFLLRHTGNDKDFLATEVSYKFDLSGPSVNVQTACSSSMVAIHLASQSLLSGECDVALAGGSTIEVPSGRGYLYREGEVLSPDGVCRPFDAESRGTVLGSGTGAVVLRRVADAVRDGDTIYAVIRGSAINNDGAGKVSYLAPSVGGHAAAISEALGVADVSADTISFFEAHGTGTAIGDPIEITAATQAFRESGATGNEYCRVGSTKANIGHLDTAAGVASVIKTALALYHRELPPLPTLTTPTTAVDFPSTPFYLSAARAPWEPIDGIRRAAVSSLGIGGTNAHIVLEEWPAAAEEASAPPATEHGWHGWHLLPISARSETALTAQAEALATHLEARAGTQLHDVAYTLQEGRAALPYRRVIAARTPAEAIATLRDEEPRRQVRGRAEGRRAGIVFMFPGGGSQYPNMARDLYEHEPVFRRYADQCIDAVNRLTEFDLRALMFPEPSAEAGKAADALARTAAALPAIFTVEYALAHLWESRGITPVAMTGHSLGEYTAACLAGVMSLEDALRLVVLRARLVDRVSTGGGMLSIATTEADLGALPDGVSVASINAPGQLVVSGLQSGIERLEATLADRDVSFQRLQLTAAGHSAMLDPILEEFRAGVGSIRLSPPQRRYVSNVTGTWVRDEDATNPDYWVRHLRQTVRFADGLETLMGSGSLVLLEVGPGQTLRSLAGQQRSAPAAAISSIRHRDDATSDLAYFARAFGQLWTAGVDVEWERMRLGTGRRVALPTYPFEHETYWIDPGDAARASTRLPLDDWFARPVWEPLPLQTGRQRARASRAREHWLIFADRHGIGADLARQLRAAGEDAVVIEPGSTMVRRSEDTFAIDPSSAAGYRGILGMLRQAGRYPTQIVHTWLLAADERHPDLHRATHAQALGFDALLLLAQALLGEGTSSPIDLSIVTAGGEAVAPHDEVAPEQALVKGIARVLPREAPEITVRTIDIEVARREDRRVLPSLWRELNEDGADRVVAWRGGTRWVPRPAPLALAEPEPTEVPVHPGGAYLVTGGLGGMGLTFAAHLVSRGAHVALLARTPLAEASVTQQEAVRRLEQSGARVLVVRADITDGAATRQAIEQVRAQLGPVRGVIHAAGTTDDEPIGTKTLEAAHLTLKPKVQGTLVLHQALRDQPLDWFVMCSSTSALVGPAGQVDYVAANAFLDAFASRRTGPGRTVAVNWGMWRDVGMLASSSTEDAAGALPGEELHPLLGHRLDDGAPPATFEQRIAPESQWVLNEHRLADGTPLLPGSSYLELITRAAGGGAFAPLEIAGLSLIEPVWGRDGSTTRVRTQVAPTGDARRVTTRALLSGDLDWRTCAEAEVRPLVEQPPAIDLASIRARFDEVSRPAAAAGTAQADLLRFGPRWDNVRALQLLEREALAVIELPAAFAPDLERYALHPAMLDTAIGAGLGLIRAQGDTDGVLVPLSYGRARVYAPIPQRVVAHVVMRSGSDPHAPSASFDVTVADEGGHVLLTVLDATFRRTTQTRIEGGGTSARPRTLTPLLEAGARFGISAREGAQALDRILAGPAVPQVIASSQSLATVERLLADNGGAGVKVERPGGEAGFVAPRDDVEAAIAGYWSELLGIERVSVDDDFFDLGGHSLIAIRLFARLRQRYNVDLGLATLFESPTVERLAALVRVEGTPGSVADGPATAPRNDSPAQQYLVPIKTSGSAQPFICVHGRGGNVLDLRDLAHRIGADIPFYGIQALGIDGKQPPHHTVEEMARAYTDALREAFPHGPYVLGGYSGGGVVALEMARLLEAAGETVRNVVLIDTYHPRLDTANLRSRYGWIADETMAAGPMRLLTIAASSLKRHAHTSAPAAAGSAALDEDESALTTAELASRHGFADLSEHFVEVQRRHVPRTYEGRVTLVRARTLSYPRTLGWSTNDLPRLRIVEVGGDHHGMMREPFVSALSAELRAEILREQ